MDLGLQGRVALVSGATRGIGREIARTLIDEGARLAICARGREGLDAAAEELQAAGGEVFAAPCDVRKRGEVEAFVDGAANALGGIDILINNVGGSAGGTLLESSDEEWEETFQLNVFHAVRTTRAALPHMQKRGGGAVVIITSISGAKPAPRAQYGSAKAAENFLAGALALELAESNVRVNAVAPGSIYFSGGGWQRFHREHAERFDDFVRREFPAQRLGSPQEVADVVAFLVSDRARWINGAVIPVDGAQGRPSVM